MPKENRDKAILAIAKALINWRISSNQSRTFSLMETLAIAISDNANSLAGAIRAKLIDDSEKAKAKPIVDETAGAELFVTLPCSGYMVTETESCLLYTSRQLRQRTLRKCPYLSSVQW